MYIFLPRELEEMIQHSDTSELYFDKHGKLGIAIEFCPSGFWKYKSIFWKKRFRDTFVSIRLQFSFLDGMFSSPIQELELLQMELLQHGFISKMIERTRDQYTVKTKPFSPFAQHLYHFLQMPKLEFREKEFLFLTDRYWNVVT